MQSDSVSRVLLTLIAICLLLLLAQGAGLLGAPSSSEASDGRYRVMVQGMRMGGSLLLRTDTATGRVWRKSLTGDGPWVLVDEESRTKQTASDS